MDPFSAMGLFKCVSAVIDGGFKIANPFVTQTLRKIPFFKDIKTKEEIDAENADRLEKIRREHAIELEQLRNENTKEIERLRFQFKIEEREASFRNELLKMSEQAKLTFNQKEYESLQKTFPLKVTTDNFSKKLLDRMERCQKAQRIPAPNLFLMLPEANQRFLFFDTLEFSQFTTGLRMLTSAGVYSNQGPTPCFNNIGAWSQSYTFQDFDSVQSLWEVSSFYPTIIIQPCYSATCQKVQLNVYYWDVNSQEKQESPNHCVFGEMSIADLRLQLVESDEYQKKLAAIPDGNESKKNELTSHTITNGVFLFYRLMTAMAAAQFIDLYYFRANYTFPQFLDAIQESFPEADARDFLFFRTQIQALLLTVLNELKFRKEVVSFEKALEQINSCGFFYQGEERLRLWINNVLEKLGEVKTAKTIANRPIYIP